GLRRDRDRLPRRGHERAPSRGSGDTHRDQQGGGGMNRRLDWEQLHVGQALGDEAAKPLTITDFVRYQGASGDMNPIHHDPAFAAKAGYPQPFAVGMRQAGYLATYGTDRFGPENVRRFRVQFREQAWPGDVITY